MNGTGSGWAQPVIGAALCLTVFAVLVRRGHPLIGAVVTILLAAVVVL